ncbi:hypothetical protein Tco_0557951 [Tanacetum coccineum]
MATTVENVIAAGKENGEMLIDSIKNGTFKLTKEIIVQAVEGVTDITCEQTPDDLAPKDRLRFVTAAKQARDLQVVKFDQLFAFLKHNEKDAKEVREMRQRFLDPLALLAKTYNPPPSYSSQNIQYHSQPSEVYQPYRFVVPIFLLTDDPIASLYKVMIFLSFAYSSRYPPTNNQLRTSSNPRTQATIQNGQVTV